MGRDEHLEVNEATAREAMLSAETIARHQAEAREAAELEETARRIAEQEKTAEREREEARARAEQEAAEEAAKEPETLLEAVIQVVKAVVDALRDYAKNPPTRAALRPEERAALAASGDPSVPTAAGADLPPAPTLDSERGTDGPEVGHLPPPLSTATARSGSQSVRAGRH